MSEAIDLSITAENLDLSNCEREPIHVPGAIQPHGVLLALQEEDLLVLQVSANCEALLGLSSDEVLGRNLSKIIGPHQAESLKQTLATHNLKTVNPTKMIVGAGPKRHTVNCILHRDKGYLFLEFEPAGEIIDAPMRAYQMLQQALQKVHAASSLPELWMVVTQEVQRILEFDRIMVYKFDRAGNGAVIEEFVTPGHETFRELHYPASDIPKQARALYALNMIRHIPDATYKPSPLIPLIFPLTQELTDLSYSQLRSVSPIHLEYLANMGVKASLSVSIMVDGLLWGLIACHNYAPKFVPYEMRTACELLGQVVSMRMAALENSGHTVAKLKTNTMTARFLSSFSAGTDLRATLVDSSPNIKDFLPCTGAAICQGDKCMILGKTPTEEQISKLTRKLKRLTSPIFVSEHVSGVFPEAHAYKEVASGVIAVTISRDQNIYIMWFRPEQIQTVNWAGDPRKPVADDGMRLSPRKSFALWKQVVDSQSIAWEQTEVESALELRSTIMSAFLNE